MLLGGLWHGAGWTFIAWGALHGIFLATNHAWQQARNTFLDFDIAKGTWFGKTSGQFLTFLVVVMSWVVFRSENFETATSMWQSMAGFHGISFPRLLQDFAKGNEAWIPSNMVIFEGMFPNNTAGGIGSLLMAGLLSWCMPNVAQIMSNTNPVIGHQPQPTTVVWHNSIYWALGVGIILGLSILGLGSATEFLYFQF